MMVYIMANRRVFLWETKFWEILKIYSLVTVLWDIVTIVILYLMVNWFIYLFICYFKLFMPAVTRKMVHLKNGILAKIDQKFREFKSDFINQIKDQIKNEISQAIGVEIKKWEEQESTVAVLQQHIKNFQKQMMVLQSENEELEQYGRRLCIRVEGVPTTDNETAEEVLKKFSHW